MYTDLFERGSDQHDVNSIPEIVSAEKRGVDKLSVVVIVPTKKKQKLIKIKT